MKNKTFILMMIGIIIIVILLLCCKNNTYEGFDNQLKDEETVQIKMQNKPLGNIKPTTPYLYPIKKLSGICAKQGLKPSFMPKACYINGNLNSYANCQCEDKKGECKICYDTIKKDTKNASIVYDPNVI